MEETEFTRLITKITEAEAHLVGVYAGLLGTLPEAETDDLRAERAELTVKLRYQLDRNGVIPTCWLISGKQEEGATSRGLMDNPTFRYVWLRWASLLGVLVENS